MVSGIRTGTAQKAKTWPAHPDRPPKILESVTNKGPTRMLNNTDSPIFSTWCTFPKHQQKQQVWNGWFVLWLGNLISYTICTTKYMAQAEYRTTRFEKHVNLEWLRTKGESPIRKGAWLVGDNHLITNPHWKYPVGIAVNQITSFQAYIKDLILMPIPFAWR